LSNEKLDLGLKITKYKKEAIFPSGVGFTVPFPSSPPSGTGFSHPFSFERFYYFVKLLVK
jgi:hypothetical protein